MSEVENERLYCCEEKCCCEPEEPGEQTPSAGGPDPESLASIELPAAEIADILKRTLLDQVTLLKGRDGLCEPEKTLHTLERIVHASQQYVVLVTGPQEPEVIDPSEKPEEEAGNDE